MIKSMTGYATAEKAGDQFSLTTEIRSYNSRHLDIVVRGLQGLNGLEERIKVFISERLTRGRIEIKVQLAEGEHAEVCFEVDRARAAAFLDGVRQLQQEFGIDGSVSIDLLIGSAGVLRPVQSELESDAAWPALKMCIEEAVDKLDRMRLREGEYISADLLERLDRVAGLLDRISAGTEGLLDHYQGRLRERINALTRGTLELDEARIAQEAAHLADRSDISEEIVRVGSHLAQFRRYMSAPEACGRRLNFLLQELNREFNTMGAKAGNAASAHLIVEAKSELEKIREQVQNVE